MIMIMINVLQHGPLPPFGNLFGMTTYVDIGTGFEGTSGAVDVAFSAGELKARLCSADGAEPCVSVLNLACCWSISIAASDLYFSLLLVNFHSCQ
jgi:hypothetical protein